jgi:nucleoside-diphosphate-sugar epimerase
MRDTFADTSRARADLGFEPRHSLEQGLAAECEWMRRHLATASR